MKNYLRLILVLLFLINSNSCSLQNPHGRNNFFHDIEVETYKITPQPKTITINTTGELQSPQTTVLTSEIMGKITYLNIPEGKEINAGHILVQINDSSLQADIKVAEAKFKNAQENFKRMEALKNEGAVSQQTLDNAIEQLHSAEGTLERANAEQRKTSIVSPFQGIVSLKKVSLGSYIDSGDEIVRVSQVDPLNLIFSIPEKYSSELKSGQNISFTAGSEKVAYNAKITAIDPYIDPSTRNIQLQAKLNNKNRALLPGQFANVTIEVQNLSNTISIPQEALIENENKKFVYVVNENNIANLTEVEVGDRDESKAQILKGLSEDLTIITSGHQKLQDGAMVIPKDFIPISNPQLDHGFSQE